MNHCAACAAVLHDYDGDREYSTGERGKLYDRRSRPTNESMPNIAAVLKDEIARIARKEARAQTAEFKKASAQYRAHIAALRRRIDELEKQVKRASKPGTRAPREVEQDDEAQTTNRRFSATRLAAQRRKLGLSAAEFAALLGVSGQSVYKWEHGEARPRARQLEAIAALRGIGKREAAARLAGLQEGGGRAS
jgi:DNA-binding transcriptional regulator YiaG